MKRMITGLAFSLLAVTAMAQKVLSEGTITYKITVVKGGDNAAVANAFADATQTLMVKGYKARTNFSSPLRSQSEVYDAQSASGFILKQSGTEKYLIMLDANKWLQFHAKYQNVKFSMLPESKQIAGYTCKKAVTQLTDGSEMAVYFTPDLVTMAKGYDLAFAGIDGIPLEYEINSKGVVLNYAASSVQMTMVSTANFEVPKSGYKLLQY